MSPGRPFGEHLRRHWLLEPGLTYLNHGTVGAPPRQVLEFQRALSDEIERNPARFMLRELADWTGAGKPTRIRTALARVATFLRCSPDDLVFVDNITAGANAVLRSFPFEPGDEIAVTTLGYGGITNAATYAARKAGALLREIELPRPGAAPQDFVDAVTSGLTPATRIVVVDHLAASTALVLPIHEVVAACHAHGTLVLVDGAHVPGNIPLDIESIGADWYTANLHKWAWAPRSCGVLWTSPAQQPHLRPVVTSWGFDNGHAAEFDLPGTRDSTALLSAPYAIELMHEFGLDEIYRYNHDLVWWAAEYLADMWGTPFDTPESMIGAMATVPLPARPGATTHDAEGLRASLEATGIEVPVLVTPSGLAVRVSAQIYCDRSDIERLGRAVVALQ